MTNRGYFARLYTMRTKLYNLIDKCKSQNTAVLNIGCGFDTFILNCDQLNTDLTKIH